MKNKFQIKQLNMLDSLTSLVIFKNTLSKQVFCFLFLKIVFKNNMHNTLIFIKY